MKKRMAWITIAGVALAFAGDAVLDHVFPDSQIDLLISETAASQKTSPKRYAAGSLFEARRRAVYRASRMISSDGGTHPYNLRRHR